MGRRLGDRKDGYLVRDIDSMHFIVPLLYPNRCDNEAFISEKIDLTNAAAFLDKKNACDPEYKYNLFQLIVTALLKCITLRPKMNRFIANKNIYQRNEVSAAFVVKKIFSDEGGEALAFIHSKPSDTLSSVHDTIFRKVSSCRGENKEDASTASMDMFNKMPRFVSKSIIACIRFLDRHGWVPRSLIATDPYYSSVVLTNLGSIKLHSGYHHLTNWGTNSVFCAIGERKMRPFYNDDGTFVMRDSVDIGLTVDERIADGYYYSKTVKLLKKLLEQPELLEQPLNTEVEY
ncbi:MAG: 2-oxo acid dehydrogenase subunit E2 [Clostridia bacterium]|nr:2-oxo acid dehydrogenase subunit E2 [Clostridia bacterium]MCR4576527.1 2-oxo acid dehydrogenase subunit E2 [Clostridiales bacterium]